MEEIHEVEEEECEGVEDQNEVFDNLDAEEDYLI